MAFLFTKLYRPNLKCASVGQATDKSPKSRAKLAIDPRGGVLAWRVGTRLGGSRRRFTMTTYMVLANFTDQGIRNIKDTTKRADVFKELARSFGATVKDVYWTLGQYDIAAIVDAPDDIIATALGLALGKSGNVRTQTLRAFSRTDMDAILGEVT